MTLKLQEYLRLTEAIHNAVVGEEFGRVEGLVEQRARIIESLKKVAENGKNRLNNPKIKSMIRTVKHLNQKSQEVIAGKEKEISGLIADLEKERNAVKELRQLTRWKQKRIVDITF